MPVRIYRYDPGSGQYEDLGEPLDDGVRERVEAHGADPTNEEQLLSELDGPRLVASESEPESEPEGETPEGEDDEVVEDSFRGVTAWHTLDQAKRYVDSPAEAPDGAELQEGPRGGLYYETEARPAPSEGEPEAQRANVTLGSAGEGDVPATLDRFGLDADAVGEQLLDGPLPDGWESEATVDVFTPPNRVDTRIEWSAAPPGEEDAMVRGGLHVIETASGRMRISFSSMDVAREHQGQGIGTRTYQGIAELAEDVKAETGKDVSVRVQANKWVGGYAWAVAGFDWVRAGDRDRFDRAVEKTIENFEDAFAEHEDEVNDDHRDALDEVREAFEALRDDADATPRDYALLGEGVLTRPWPTVPPEEYLGRGLRGEEFREEMTEPMHVGKVALLGVRWAGELDV